MCLYLEKATRAAVAKSGDYPRPISSLIFTEPIVFKGPQRDIVPRLVPLEADETRKKGEGWIDYSITTRRRLKMYPACVCVCVCVCLCVFVFCDCVGL